MQSRKVNEDRPDSKEPEVRTGATKTGSIASETSFPFRIARAAACGILIGLVGCTTTVDVDDLLPEREPSYKSSTSLPPLEVPPDLARTAVNDPLALPQNQAIDAQSAGRDTPFASAVLPDVDRISLERDGNRRWLVVEGEPEALWPLLRDFWQRRGFALAREESLAGVMETEWLERSGDASQGLFQSLLGNLSRAFYGTGIRDRYRTRFERGAKAGTTEIYVTHRGAERIFYDGDASGQQRREGVGEMVWKPIAADPGLEAEMLTRIMVFLGLNESEAGALIDGAGTEGAGAVPALGARLESDERHPLFLVWDEDLPSAWQRLGLALDRAGFVIDDRDRGQGLYRVRDDADASGASSASWLSGLKFWERSERRPKSYRLLLVESGVEEGASKRTRLIVQDEPGTVDAGPDAMRILSRVQEFLD